MVNFYTFWYKFDFLQIRTYYSWKPEISTVGVEFDALYTLLSRFCFVPHYFYDLWYLFDFLVNGLKYSKYALLSSKELMWTLYVACHPCHHRPPSSGFLYGYLCPVWPPWSFEFLRSDTNRLVDSFAPTIFCCALWSGWMHRSSQRNHWYQQKCFLFIYFYLKLHARWRVLDWVELIWFRVDWTFFDHGGVRLHIGGYRYYFWES